MYMQIHCVEAKSVTYFTDHLPVICLAGEVWGCVSAVTTIFIAKVVSSSYNIFFLWIERDNDIDTTNWSKPQSAAYIDKPFVWGKFLCPKLILISKMLCMRNNMINDCI